MLVPRTLALDPAVRKLIDTPRMYAPMLSSLLNPVALVGYMLACWRLGADLNVTGEFFISQGLFSRWQVWLALAIITQFGAKELNRRVRSNDSAIS